MNDLADAYGVADSEDRYKWLTNEALDMYGTLNLNTGAILMDYLHPPKYDYYPIGSNVGAAITCWDLTSLQAKALFGNYDDDWVVVSL